MEETRADDLARARRGLGYVYVKLGQLTEAENKYRQCLATNPNDARAQDDQVQGTGADSAQPSHDVGSVDVVLHDGREAGRRVLVGDDGR